jgi:hypothetical protein
VKPKKRTQFIEAGRSTLYLEIDGHMLFAEKRGQWWKFECPSWPELNDRRSLGPVIETFMQRALERRDSTQ